MDEAAVEADRALRQRVRAERGFYVHAMIYGAVMTFLLLINLMTDGSWWVQWPILGWGIAVAINGIAVFSRISLFGTDWEERRMRQLRGHANQAPEA